MAGSPGEPEEPAAGRSTSANRAGDEGREAALTATSEDRRKATIKDRRRDYRANPAKVPHGMQKIRRELDVPGLRPGSN